MLLSSIRMEGVISATTIAMPMQASAARMGVKRSAIVDVELGSGSMRLPADPVFRTRITACDLLNFYICV